MEIFKEDGIIQNQEYNSTINNYAAAHRRGCFNVTAED